MQVHYPRKIKNYSINGLLFLGLTLIYCNASAVTCSGSSISISSGEICSGSFAIDNRGIVDTIANNGGKILGSNIAIYNSGIITSIDNTSGGQISGDSLGIYSTGSVTSIINNTDSQIIGYTDGGLQNTGALNSVTNSGTISGLYGIRNFSNISLINNVSSGLIEGTSDAGIRQETGASIGTITNNGQILGGTSGIFNLGVITTLNNAQGGNSSLIYTGKLPQNYNIILGSNANSYGKLAVTSVTSWDGAGGTTTFGIYSGSVKSTKYTAMISGVTAGLLNTSTLSGTYSSGGKSYAYSLTLESGSLTVWDLLFPTYVEPVVVPIAPSVANTNQSLVNTASALQGTYTLQNSVLANSFSYDCTVFGANNVCVSAGGRNTQVQAANGLNNTSALLIAAYRPHPNYRIGAYADQNLSVSNPGGTVNLGNNTPLIGLFAAWNERLDGTGTEVKVSAAYGQKNTTITRSVVGSGAGASEAGSGSSTLNSQGAQVTAKYGFGIMDNVIVSPYVGVRYTQNNMGGYTEGTSSSVTAPLTYNALNTNATTALAGVGASYRVIPTVMTFASAGVETDTNTANGTYAATNASIGALTPVNFNANPVRTRPTATVGAYYDIEKNQRLGVTGIYRQEAYQAVSTTTVMATYTIGL